MTPALGFVVALEMEGRWIDSPALIEVSGVGERRAEAAALRLLDRGATALVSWGVAGGLDPNLTPGTVVLPDFVIQADGSRIDVDASWRDRLLTMVQGRVDTSTLPLLHASQAVTTPEKKSELYRRTGAAAVDMESAAVAAVATKAGVGFIVIRVVVDAARDRLPESALTMCDEEGRLKKSAVLRLIGRPGDWGGMLKLGRANRSAAKSMKRVWSIAGPDLARTEPRE